MRVLFVSPSFYPAFHYGGPIFINRAFCDALGKHEKVQVEVLTTDANGPGRRIDPESARANHVDSYSITYCRRVLPPDIAPGLLFRLPGMIRRADVVHLNGVYSFTTMPTLILCRIFKKPLVCSTMGALQRWQRTSRKHLKSVWEKIFNALCDANQVVLHVTSEEEKTESLEKIPNASAMILRNGIAIPGLNGKRKLNRTRSLRLLYIGRLHPIKGIENLLQALTLVKGSVRLAICGEGDPAYETDLRELAASLGITEIVSFHGRVDGELKEQHFRDADLCITPSFKEAFCTVILESLARAVPVIASRGIPWEKVGEKGCGLWVGNEPQELASAIDRAAAMPLAEMGQLGRAWMKEDYSWAHVANEMIAEYERRICSLNGNDIQVAASPKIA